MADETRIIRIVIDSSKAVDGSAAATRAFEKMERAQSDSVSALDRMEMSLGRVGGYLKAQLALMVSEVASRLISMAKSALEAAGDMGELAQQMGITVRGLQGLQYAGIQNRISLEQLETGVGKFSQKIGEAAGGSKEMIDSLNAMGIKILDVHGKLLPTEKLMQAAAVAITSMSDPATQAAAAVDLFGKAGVKMLPTLKDVAAGFDDMAEKAKRGGAMISQEAIDKLDKLGDAGSRTQLRMRALFAENAAGPLTEVIDFVSRKLENLSNILKAAKGNLVALLAFAANPSALIGAALGSSPQEKAAADIAKLQGTIAANQSTLDGMGPNDARRRYLEAAQGKATSQLELLQRQAGVLAVGGKTDGALPSDPDSIGISIPFVPKGVSNPAATGSGAGVSDAIAKLGRDTAREVAAANSYAEASERGARAVADLEIHFKALKAAQDAYGKTADQNTGQVGALTKVIEEQMRAAERAKSLKDFNLGTEELERANQLLEVENALINANAEDRAREVALIRLKNDVQTKGLDENNPKEREAIDRRREAITQNERLKAQGEELKKANELWTAPLKSALESIQSAAADMFDSMLERGSFSLDELGNIAKRMVRRMIAEFASLAVIRPMLAGVVGGLSAIGLVSPATAASLGYGASGTSGFSMPSLGGFGGGITGSLGSFGEWLNTPFTGAYAGVSPASMAGVPTIGGSSTTGVAGTGITPLGAFGAAAGAGMGIYQLATAKNTAQTIGGIGTMIGAGVSLIPGVGQIAGPIIMALSSILPGLFGGEEYKWPPLAGANVQFNPGAGGYFSTATQQLGGASIADQYAGVGQTLDAFFKAAGGITDESRAFGAAIWQNQREGTTSTYEISPSQGSHQLSEGSGDQSAAVDRMIAKVFYNSIQNNAAMNASPTLRTAFSNREPTGTAQISGLFDLIQAYDALGKGDNITKAEMALKEIDASFASLSAGAREWGLSMAPITAEITKQRTAYAEDFLHTINSVLDPVGTALEDFAKERADGMKEWAYINDNVKEFVIAQAKVEEFYARKEAALREQLNGGVVTQLEEAIKRLSPGGALSNLDPIGTLAGMKASYRATYGQATGGDAAAIARLAGEGTGLAEFGKSYFAGSPEYNALRDEILANFQTIQAAIQSPTGSSTPLNTSDPGIQTLVQQNQILQQTVQTLVENDKRKSEEVARLTNLLSRYLTNGQRAA